MGVHNTALANSKTQGRKNMTSQSTESSPVIAASISQSSDDDSISVMKEENFVSESEEIPDLDLDNRVKLDLLLPSDTPAPKVRLTTKEADSLVREIQEGREEEENLAVPIVMPKLKNLKAN